MLYLKSAKVLTVGALSHSSEVSSKEQENIEFSHVTSRDGHAAYCRLLRGNKHVFSGSEFGKYGCHMAMQTIVLCDFSWERNKCLLSSTTEKKGNNSTHCRLVKQ